MLRFLLDHCLMIIFILSILSDQLSTMLCALMSLRKWTPSILICLTHFRYWCSALLLLSLPSHIASVFYLFILKPDMFANWLNTVIATSRSSLSLRNSVVSSANRRIFTIVFGGLVSICIFFTLAQRILIARISTARINSSGDRGHPCLTPRLTWTGSDIQP